MQKDLVGEDNMTKWASHGPMANPSVALGTKIGPMPGELVAVCGRVAAGKSSLLLAMLGEMKGDASASVCLPGGPTPHVAMKNG